jgi:hypothetical protein
LEASLGTKLHQDEPSGMLTHAIRRQIFVESCQVLFGVCFEEISSSSNAMKLFPKPSLRWLHYKVSKVVPVLRSITIQTCIAETHLKPRFCVLRVRDWNMIFQNDVFPLEVRLHVFRKSSMKVVWKTLPISAFTSQVLVWPTSRAHLPSTLDVQCVLKGDFCSTIPSAHATWHFTFNDPDFGTCGESHVATLSKYQVSGFALPQKLWHEGYLSHIVTRDADIATFWEAILRACSSRTGQKTAPVTHAAIPIALAMAFVRFTSVLLPVTVAHLAIDGT